MANFGNRVTNTYKILKFILNIQQNKQNKMTSFKEFQALFLLYLLNSFYEAYIQALLMVSAFSPSYLSPCVLLSV